jgi:hypothetical protein
MNKLTTINTIKKAAPLALLAVVMSGSAFAGPGKGQGPKDKGDGQASIDVYTVCSFEYYMNYEYKPTLVVETTITDASDDTPGVTPILGAKTVQAKQKSRGPERDLLGAQIDDPAALGTTTEYIELCADGVNPLDPNSTALGAVVTVILENGRKSEYGGRCENPYTDYNNDGIDDADESDIDIPAGLCLQ